MKIFLCLLVVVSESARSHSFGGKAVTGNSGTGLSSAGGLKSTQSYNHNHHSHYVSSYINNSHNHSNSHTYASSHGPTIARGGAGSMGQKNSKNKSSSSNNGGGAAAAPPSTSDYGIDAKSNVRLFTFVSKLILKTIFSSNVLVSLWILWFFQH